MGANLQPKQNSECLIWTWCQSFHYLFVLRSIFVWIWCSQLQTIVLTSASCGISMKHLESISLSVTFYFSYHSSRSPAACFPSSFSFSHTSSLLSLSLNDLIPPMCLCIYLLAYDRVSRWKLPRGAWMWRRRFLLVSTWACCNCVATWRWEIGYFLHV